MRFRGFTMWRLCGFKILWFCNYEISLLHAALRFTIYDFAIHDFTYFIGFVILRSCNFVKLQFYDCDMSQFQEETSCRLPSFRNWTGPQRNVSVLHACTYCRCAPLCSSREVHQAVTPLPFSVWFSSHFFVLSRGGGETESKRGWLDVKVERGRCVEGEERRRVQLDLTLSMVWPMTVSDPTWPDLI